MSTAQFNRSYFFTNANEAEPFLSGFPNFTFDELASHDGSGLLIHWGALSTLQDLRRLIGSPIVVNSAYRSIHWNSRVGGAANSYHLSGQAFDIRTAALDLSQLAAQARRAGFTGIGIYDNFVHVDIGTTRQWRD